MFRKLTDDQVREIRESGRLRETLRARVNRLSNAALAKRFGVNVRTIEKALSGERWRSVE